MRERLGTVSEARDKLDLPDAAAVWDAVASGELHAERTYSGDPWTIYKTNG